MSAKRTLGILVLTLACSDATMPGPIPVARFTTQCRPSACVVNGSASSGPIVRWRYDFGDGTMIDHGDGIWAHDYAKPGIYTIKLTVITADGRSDSAQQTGDAR